LWSSTLPEATRNDDRTPERKMTTSNGIVAVVRAPLGRDDNWNVEPFYRNASFRYFLVNDTININNNIKTTMDQGYLE
jgi:hypothetical protein